MKAVNQSIGINILLLIVVFIEVAQFVQIKGWLL